ncbi:GNAT family N-acetyltransferase [Mycobacterium sp. NPDC006124]|uniref:GNAT family N-acetyltransferase n=1 Tax=Mycobacterium sp. NPDC006124 TaxID=3156729 RepID=UPI0033A272B5
MPSLIQPALPTGSFSVSAHPCIAVDADAVLRPWILADADALVEAFDDPAIRQWHLSRADTEDEARELITRWQGGWAAESEFNWAIVGPDDALLGRIALKGVDLFEATAGVAYWMCPESRGRGLCPRAVVTLSEWAFTAGFHRLQLEHSTRNAPSCRVATKAGFREEGTRRGAALHRDGWHDMHAHARLRGDE